MSGGKASMHHCLSKLQELRTLYDGTLKREIQQLLSVCHMDLG